MKKEQDIDNIFKHGLGDPVDEAVFQENDWDALEQMLDKRKKRPGIIFWLPVLSSAAALLIFFGWWILRPQSTDHPQKIQQQVAVNKVQKEQVAADRAQKSQQQLAAVDQPKNNNTGEPAVNTTKNNKTEKALTTNPQHQREQTQYMASATGGSKHTVKNSPVNNEEVNGLNKNNGGSPIADNGQSSIANTRDYAALTAVRLSFDHTEAYDQDLSKNNNMPVIASIDILPKTTVGSQNNNNAKGNKGLSKEKGLSYHPLFALSVLASSEQNGVNSLQRTSTGSNVGLLFSVGVKKFTLSTGATYSLKPYTLPFDDYHTTYKFKNTPEYVSADCRVLDIPINLDYQVYNKHRNKISLGTGLSSYIMMHESYTYDYGRSDILYGPSYYAVKTRGKYLFSIMNLQATYQRQINSKVGINLQPYLKVPLSNIGYSQIKVETFGVAVGLNWNINSLTKP